ncbi:MAG: hypothetical protein WAT92_00375 [Saprospiraceae bacterium]
MSENLNPKVLELESKILELEKQLLAKDQQIVKSETKAISYLEKYELLESFPEIAKLDALMKYEIKIANQLVSSKAFPNMTGEQAYVLIKAGSEMNLKPMESLKKLYIVNGAVGFHGAGLVATLTEKGVILSYEDETEHGVTVVANYQGKTYIEIVTDKDQILTKSKAMTFAKKNKMRFHGVRMIANFYLAHLTGSVIVWEHDDIEATKVLEKGKDYLDLSEAIENAETLEALTKLYDENKKFITNPKNIDLLISYGRVKKQFEL